MTEQKSEINRTEISLSEEGSHKEAGFIDERVKIFQQFRHFKTKIQKLEKERETFLKKQTPIKQKKLKLIAVSKHQPLYKIEAALETGHRIFGENKVQEAIQKWEALREKNSDIELHFIGHLQTNKVKQVVQFFETIHSIDRKKLLKALANAVEKQDKMPALYIQINTGEEPQKSGVFPSDADAFLKAMREEYQLVPQGLMCLPPANAPTSIHFTRLKQIAERNGLENLSMGMSADYEEAIRSGATHIRLGRALFGERPNPS